MPVAARMLCAAEWAGTEPFCAHVQQPRPMFVMCHPRFVICVIV